RASAGSESTDVRETESAPRWCPERRLEGACGSPRRARRWVLSAAREAAPRPARPSTPPPAAPGPLDASVLPPWAGGIVARGSTGSPRASYPPLVLSLSKDEVATEPLAGRRRLAH